MEIHFLQNPAAIWLMIGIILGVSELFVPGLVILFFGIGALITSVFAYFIDMSVVIQVVLFLTTSVVSLVVFRTTLKQRFFREIEEKDEFVAKEFVGRTARVTRVNDDGITGHVEFRGTSWTVVSNEPIEVGDLVEITSKESIKLFVTKATNN